MKNSSQLNNEKKHKGHICKTYLQCNQDFQSLLISYLDDLVWKQVEYVKSATYKLVSIECFEEREIKWSHQY